MFFHTRSQEHEAVLALELQARDAERQSARVLQSRGGLVLANRALLRVSVSSQDIGTLAG
jgi:hypothetical protein